MKLVLISGKQGSGKSTLQQALLRAAKERFKWHGQDINFADPLYDLHNVVLNRLMAAYNIPRTTDKDGLLLQVLGTEWGRKKDENFWINIAKKRLEAARLYCEIAVVGDCRFENEFDAFPSALHVRLDAGEEIRKTRTHSWRENTQHPSERGLDHYDYLNKFDLVIDTEHFPTEHGVELILAKLQQEGLFEL